MTVLSSTLEESWSAQPWSNVHLGPGEVLISREDVWVATVLGSCVAVVMHAPEAPLAAICHAVLPGSCKCSGRAYRERLRYLDEAVCEMLEAFDRAEVPRASIEAKLFGGASVLRGSGETRSPFAVGAKNILRAEELLSLAGLRVVGRCVGGNFGRKVVFNTRSGDVFVRRVGGNGS